MPPPRCLQKGPPPQKISLILMIFSHNFAKNYTYMIFFLTFGKNTNFSWSFFFRFFHFFLQNYKAALMTFFSKKLIQSCFFVILLEIPVSDATFSPNFQKKSTLFSCSVFVKKSMKSNFEYCNFDKIIHILHTIISFFGVAPKFLMFVCAFWPAGCWRLWRLHKPKCARDQFKFRGNP